MIAIKQFVLISMCGKQCIDIGTSIGWEYTVLAAPLHEVTEYTIWP